MKTSRRALALTTSTLALAGGLALSLAGPAQALPADRDLLVQAPAGSGDPVPDGTRVTVAPDGTRVTSTPDGTRVTATPEGTRVTAVPGDRDLVAPPAPDGTRVTATPDGTRVTAAPDGTRVTLAAAAPTISPATRVSWVPPNSDYACDPGNLCTLVWDPTRSAYKIFYLYTCNRYSLTAWSGSGFYVNKQTGGARASFYGSDGGLLRTAPADGVQYAYNWSPVWSIRNC